MACPFELSLTCIEVHPTGSNYICNPPVEDTDIDFVCLVDRFFNPEELGYVKTSKEYVGLIYFKTYRKDNLNLITTEDKNFFKKFVEATEEAKEKNLLNKEDRIMLFQERLYQNCFEDEIPI